jgi:glutamate-1-semialdehyde 2,1-aminomutase
MAALAQLDEAAYRRLDATAARLADGLAAAVSGAGLPVQVPRVGPLVGIFFVDKPVRDFDDARDAAENGLYKDFFHGMLRRGIAFAPGPYEALFPSLAHSDEDIDLTVAAAAEVAEELARAAR